MALLLSAVPVSGERWTGLAAARPGVSNGTDFDRFFLDHYDLLVRSVSAMTGDREEAADAVQEAFIRAYARWHRVRRLDNPVTWVRRVAINRTRDQHRARSRRRRREDSVSVGTSFAGPSPAERVDSDLQLVDLLLRLSPQQRSVAALFYIEDISVAEIAASLDLSVGAVKFHLNKARKTLRAILEQEAVAHG